MNQPILLYRSGSVYANETAAWAALDAVTHKKGQPIVAFYTLSSPVSGHHGSSTIGAIFAIGIGDGVGQYKACTSHDDMLIVAQSLNAHITQFNQMFEYDANHNAIKAKLDFYTTDGKSISAGGIGSGSSASLGALYQLVDVMANSSNTGVEGAVEGSVLAYNATAGKWKAIAQSEILPDMSGYYTKDETDSAINTAKSNLQGQVDTLQALIPATASATNQLADKDFVNSSIATATAEFKGSFTSLDELKATSGNLNDYAFYLHKDSVGNSIVDRYKWTTAGWLYEYTLNNSSFTAEQWAALNSAITATLVQSYNNHLKNSTIHITSDERTKWNNKWDYNEATIKAVKVNAAVSADKLATANEGTSAIPIYFKNGKPAQCIPSDLFSGFANAYSSTGERSLGITIAGHTRMVVVAYSTLAGSADKLATARTLWGQSFDGSANVSGDLKDVRNITASGKAIIQGDIVCGGEVVAVAGEGTPAGVTDYSALTGKPQINGVTLVSGNNTLAALGIQAAGDYVTNSGVTTLLADYTTKTFVSNNYAGKSAFNSHIADTNIHITSAERAAWNAKWDYNEATIKAVKVTSASSADSVAWPGISGKPTTFTPSAHTHTASEISGLPTNLSAFTNDVGYVSVRQKNGCSYNNLNSLYNNALIYRIDLTDVQVNIWTMLFIEVSLRQHHSLGYAGKILINLYHGSASDFKAFNATILGNLNNINVYGSDRRYIYIYASMSYSTISVDRVLVGDNAINYDLSNITIEKVDSLPDTYQTATIYNGLHSGNYNSYAPTLTGTGASGTWGIDISGNASSATKLQTPRTIWGQSFDGSANVSGDLIDVGNISASGKATIQGDIVCGGEVAVIAGEGTPAGVTDYSALTGKPSINGITLVSGNNTLAALGIQAAGDYATNSGVTTLLADYTTKTFVANNYAGKSAFNAHTADTDIHITAAERDAWNAKWDYNEATIKAVKVTAASSADSVAWSGIKDKPTTFTPSAHTHAASDVSGLPTSLKNPYALTFGSKTYDGSAAATITASDLGALTSITKSMVEGVLTGNITSHTHTFASLTSKPTTLSGYGITDTLNFSIDTNYLAARFPTQDLANKAANTYIEWWQSGAGFFNFKAGKYIVAGGTSSHFLKGDGSLDSNTYLNTTNYNSYAPTLTGTGASGTWGINITGNAATATNADKLDGYHSYAFRRDWGTKAGGSHIGWVRIMKWTASKAGAFSPQPFLLSLYRAYNSPATETYTLSFTFGRDTANIVQLNGNGGTRIIEKFRISKTTDQLTYYLEYYVNPNYSIYTNVCYCIISSCYSFDSVELINEVASGDTSTLHEITTKLNSIVGNIEGSATKLQTPRTIWGQSFDGTSDVNGDAHITGDLIVDGEVSALVA